MSRDYVPPRLLALATTMLFQGAAFSAPPSMDSFAVTTELTHSDNAALSATNQQAVQTLRVLPSWSRRWLSGQDDISIKLSATLERSSDTELRMNRTDPAAQLRWQRTAEQSEMGVQLNYSNDSARSAALDESGQRVSDDTRTNKGASANYSYQLSERQNAGLNLSFQHVSFDKHTQANYTNAAAGATLQHRFSEFTDVTLGLDGSAYTPDPTPAAPLAARSQSYGTSLKLRRQLSEQLEASGQLGVLRIERHGQDHIGTWQGNFSITHTGQSVTTRFNLGRSSVVDNTTGGYSVSDSARIQADYPLSNTSSIGAQVSWQRTDSLVDTISRLFSVTYSAQLSERWRWSLNLSERVLNRQDPSAITERYLGAQINYSTPDL